MASNHAGTFLVEVKSMIEIFAALMGVGFFIVAPCFFLYSEGHSGYTREGSENEQPIHTTLPGLLLFVGVPCVALFVALAVAIGVVFNLPVLPAVVAGFFMTIPAAGICLKAGYKVRHDKVTKSSVEA